MGLSCLGLRHRAALAAQNLGCHSLVKPGPKGQLGGSVGCASMRWYICSCGGFLDAACVSAAN